MQNGFRIVNSVSIFSFDLLVVRFRFRASYGLICPLLGKLSEDFDETSTWDSSRRDQFGYGCDIRAMERRRNSFGSPQQWQSIALCRGETPAVDRGRERTFSAGTPGAAAAPAGRGCDR